MIAVNPSKLTPHNLLPVSQVGNVFSSFFPYLFQWIHTPRDRRDWHTETKYPLTARTLWDKHQDKRQVIGVRFGEFTEYCMIDIDRKSPNHPLNSAANFDKILKACYSIGLDGYILIRSSASEGLHIYFPLEEKVKTFSLACGLRRTLEEHGFEIASGVLETFPNTKTYNSEYNGHRLPLQDGSYICRDDISPITNSVERFVDLWMSRSECQDLERLTEFCDAARASYKPKFANTAKLNNWKAELETTISQGWTGHKQTNSLLFKIAEYGRVFLGYTDIERLCKYVTDTALEANGFRQFSSHVSDLVQRARDWAKWVFEHRFPMQSKEGKQTVVTGIREKKKAETIQRIRDAASSISDRHGDDLGVKELANKIARMAGCSLATLYKNLSLWHPDHKDAVTANFNDSQADLAVANQLQETAKNQSQHTVTQKDYEVCVHDPTAQESLKFAAPSFQPSRSAPAPAPHRRLSFFTETEIKLLESKVTARLMGRPSADDLREVEDLRARILSLRRSLQE